MLSVGAAASGAKDEHKEYCGKFGLFNPTSNGNLVIGSGLPQKGSWIKEVRATQFHIQVAYADNLVGGNNKMGLSKTSIRTDHTELNWDIGLNAELSLDRCEFWKITGALGYGKHTTVDNRMDSIKDTHSLDKSIGISFSVPLFGPKIAP